jgi:hypothetical protein
LGQYFHDNNNEINDIEIISSTQPSSPNRLQLSSPLPKRRIMNYFSQSSPMNCKDFRHSDDVIHEIDGDKKTKRSNSIKVGQKQDNELVHIGNNDQDVVNIDNSKLKHFNETKDENQLNNSDGSESDVVVVKSVLTTKKQKNLRDLFKKQ